MAVKSVGVNIKDKVRLNEFETLSCSEPVDVLDRVVEFVAGSTLDILDVVLSDSVVDCDKVHDGACERLSL